MNLANQARGRFGEDMAARWYERQGFEIVDRNWRCRDGEIDIVARGHGLIVVCEVKARASARYGTPAEAVTWAKRARLRRLAMAWLAVHRSGRLGLRIDVACVTGATIVVLEGVV